MTLDYFYGQSGELFSYFRIPKALFQDCRFRQLSTDARTLYGILLDRMSLSAKNGWLDEQGRVYIIYTVREVQESLCCAEHKAVKLFRELEDIDLIERKRRGLGRPSLIYVKDFSSGLPKAQVQNCPNSNSGAAESATLVQPKPQANKTDKNKTEWNDPDPIYSGGIREQLEDYFYQSLEVDLLLRRDGVALVPAILDLTHSGGSAEGDLVQLILAVDHHAAPDPQTDKHLCQRLHKVFIVDAQQLHFGGAGVGEGAKNVEHCEEAQLPADGTHIFHGGVVLLGKEEADTHLVQQFHATGGALLNVHAQCFQTVGGAALGGGGPVAVLCHLHAACRRSGFYFIQRGLYLHGRFPFL